MMSRDSGTSLSLLARLKEDPQGSRSWEQFVHRYQPHVFEWCRKWGLQESDAHDVSQNVMLELAQQIQKFEYKPGGKFRAWLRTVVRRAWYDYKMRKKNIEYQVANSGFWGRVTGEDAEQDLLNRMEEECNRELLETAMENVKSRVKPETWQAFELTELEHLSADETATRTGLSRGSIYVARGRVQKMLIEEVHRIDTVR